MAALRGVAALDLTDQATITPTLERLLKSHQPPQLLINNAGAAYTGDLVSMPLERWNWLIQLNLTSVLQVCAAVVVPAMRPAGGLGHQREQSCCSTTPFPGWGAYCIGESCFSQFHPLPSRGRAIPRNSGLHAHPRRCGHLPVGFTETVQQ